MELYLKGARGCKVGAAFVQWERFACKGGNVETGGGLNRRRC